ncbi:MAG: cysteine--tRNA ligase [Planctomycetaceae bacterium]|jgi:cysteinyl-tRNA synthetase|nr:cysteine--tRNA ligase [Planctomycetaceae bacterium]
MIRVYNTITKTKEEFKPVVSGKVGIYLCGPTVYKPSHIGHMVGPVIFDMIKRYLKYNGYEVRFIINITDVDDKLIAESNLRKLPMGAIAEEMTVDYMSNLAAMGVKDSVDAFPKATDHIGNIIKFTQDLIDKGFAYQSDGDVYFDVSKYAEYGKLSHRSVEQMSGEGGGMVSRKRAPMDFALWKSAKPHEPSWDSPWGKGRPGWHIECSVMSCELLGETFDIHGGGLDLVFPHHENEIAQSESRNGKPMCCYWLHNGLMQESGEVGKVGGRNTHAVEEGNIQSQEIGKISKSKGAGAFCDMLKRFTPENIRFFLLSTHYRRPIDFSFGRIEEVGKGLETFYRFAKRFEKITSKNFYQLPTPTNRNDGEILRESFGSGLGLRLQFCDSVFGYRLKFLEAMDDDFNSGGAIGILFELLRELNKFIDDSRLEFGCDGGLVLVLLYGATVLRELGLLLGLFYEQPKEFEDAGSSELVSKLVELLIDLRNSARQNKDFNTADKIRTNMNQIGIQLEDHAGITDWSIIK